MSASNSIIIKQFVPKDKTQTHGKLKRVRPQVPDAQRKRVRIACESCRLRKEKCDGSVPCQRCSREATVCVPGTLSASSRMSQPERIGRLQLVVQHTLGIQSLSDEELRTISDSISGNEHDASGKDDTTHLGNSLSTFSQELERKLGDSKERHDAPDHEEDHEEVHEEDKGGDLITEFCHSPSPIPTRTRSFLQSVLAIQPSRTVAERLARVYFDKVQCNSFQVQESWIFDNLRTLYHKDASCQHLDIPVIATISLVMALGSQFSSDTALGQLGPLLYEQAASITPELIKRSDFESTRACLLLATYLFPIDHSGTAYTYLGLSLHMAMGQKLHQDCHDEVKVRVWWTLYTFYQRARIFHGHPQTLTYDDVTVRRPRRDANLEPANGISNFDNQVVLIEITITLESIAKEIASLRKRRKAVHMANLLALRHKLLDIQSQLPSLELATDTARLRLDIHLYLFYWHARLHLGRPFLLEPSSAGPPAAFTLAEHTPAGILFAQDAFDAAMEIIRLCQKIHVEIGLSQASYVTEFTSCRAAMLVLIAKAITDKSTALNDSLVQGLELIQYLSAGQSKASSETRVIAALQRAIARLHQRSQRSDQTGQGLVNEYTREWEMLWQQQSLNYEPSTNLEQHHTGNNMESLQYGVELGLPSIEYGVFDIGDLNFNTQLEEFSLFPLGDRDMGLEFESIT